MHHFRIGSHLYRIVTLLSVVGEYPMCSLHLLGNERVYKALIHKLTKPQILRNYHTGEELRCRLLTVTGKGKNKSLRFFKGALSILDWINEDTYQYYMNSFWNHRFPGDAIHRERNHRVAEAVAMCICAGVEVRPYILPVLQNMEQLYIIPDEPALYLAKEVKRVGGEEMNKTMFTRMVGALFSHGTCYAVYNTREAVMKWSGMGEFKAKHSLIEIGRLNAGITQVEDALLFGESYEIALKTLIESDKSRRFEFRFDSIYRHVYFLPMNEIGMRVLKIILMPDWNEKILDLLFEPETRSYNQGFFEYDACVNDVYILSHLDSDLARLIRFREAHTIQTGMFEVLCYPHQVPFLREYLGHDVTIKTIDIHSVEAALGPDRRRRIEY